MPKNGQYEYKIETDKITIIEIDDYSNEEVINDSMSKQGIF